MIWSYPWAFALALLTIPLVIGFLNRRKVSRKAVPSVILFRAIATEEASHKKYALPQHMIALLLCLCAIGLMVLTLAKPDYEDSAPKRYVVVLDVSASMGAVGEGGSRIDLARSEIRSFVERLQAGDEVGLVVNGVTAEVALGPTADHAYFLETLDRSPWA